jgi:DNA-binding MurR/RpiR family transcriptional regulator
MNCVTRISQYYNFFTKAERKIADYIIQNPEETVRLTIYDLADVTGVAPSTVTRFVHNLEYKNFNEMRMELVRSVDVNTVNDFNEILQWGNSKNDLSQHFLHNVTSVCQETLSINQMEKFQETASLVNKASLVFFFGVGASSLIVQDMQQKLMKMHKRCIYNMDGNFGAQNALMASSDDIVIAVSYSGITREVNLAAQRAQQNGCKIIAITRYGHTSLSGIADICLFVPNVEQVTKVAAIFSRYAQLFIVDILFLNFVNECGENPAKMLTDYRSLLLKLKE